MKTTITFTESSSSHESYCEYQIEIEYSLTRGGEVNSFKVVDVESITLYPCGSKSGLEVRIAHESPYAARELNRQVDAMLRADKQLACEEILKAHASELAAA